MAKEHIFVIAAYGENPYLEDCVRSLLSQSESSQICISTSTPNDHIQAIATKYSLPLRCNSDRGISGDWNFALSLYSEIPYLTIAHQDDIYFPDFTRKVVDILKRTPDSQICFTNFKELKDASYSSLKAYILIKSFLLLPFFIKSRINSRLVKKMVLSLGNPVSCSSVTFNRQNIKNFSFVETMEVNLDWYAWCELAQKEGTFCFLRKPLIAHRLSSYNETSVSISDRRRHKEDLEMFGLFWPNAIVKVIMFFYKLSYKKEIY